MRSRGFPQLRTLIEGIDRILIGKTAEQTDPGVREGVNFIVRLPTWTELPPAINVGMKAKKNEDLVLPARIEWNVPPLVMVTPGESVEVEWRITNMGHRKSGTITLTELGQSELIPGQLDGAVIGTFSSRDLNRKLTKLVTDGQSAKWEVLNSFEEYTRSKITEASRILAQEFSELSGRSIPGVLDENAIDALLAEMLFGERESKKDSSIVSRMVDKALDPNAFNDYDPARFFTLNLKARALGEVKRVIGDPHIGPKIRRVHRMSGATTIEAVVAAYNEQYPKEHLGAKRAMAALTAGHQLEVMAGALAPDDELRDWAQSELDAVEPDETPETESDA
ncbi:hypothetical protein [Leifsonia sp. Leaf264]|uniref:hypothetical protein n=1 Tax=Leifsonia sp. Leaf264 TaxID=1736314 RepID=UPI0006FE2A00|nr:hypothetical protein [Leifsonia sp. Leaf264]KQO98869.1 hypothetical protein ASF30_12465 [Leifsonia sp. Leaf264]